MKPIIVVENVFKKFSRNTNAHLDYGIRDLVREILGHNRTTVLRQDEFVVVNDLSFALYPGESLALIGRNGSGKTTTLKMLNGTLKPDAGRISFNGRVQALISLGTGFNPKLSGRENIYNAAAVLGLNRKKTQDIIDEVIDFSELDDFIDSPVQTYSSGMKARLGFSVAVHLKPEILLIDEILSVGDYAFQNKCFVKMNQLQNEGTTIILVSHNHAKVLQICKQAIWLHQGKTAKIGPSKEVVKNYLSFLDEQEAQKVKKPNRLPERQKSRTDQKNKPQRTIYGAFIYESFEHIDDLKVSLLVKNHKVDVFKLYDDLCIEYSFNLKQTVKNLSVNLIFYRKADGFHYGKISTLNGDVLKHIHSGRVNCRVVIPNFNLNPDNYVLLMAIREAHSFLYRNIVKEFTVIGNGELTWGLLTFKHCYEILGDGGCSKKVTD